MLVLPTNWNWTPKCHHSEASCHDGTSDSERRLGRRHKITEMPEYLRFNPWILTGYRPADLTTIECFKSIGYVHNETVNILTHSLPLLFVLLYFEKLFEERLFVSYLTYCHLVGSITPWLGSLTYHVLMNHRSGKTFYQKLLKADMLGIWITQTFGALTTISSSFILCSQSLCTSLLTIYLILSLFALYKSLTASSAWQRPVSFALLVCVRIIAFIVRLGTHSTYPGVYQHLWHVVMQEVWPILGSIISATRVPERFFPGHFDHFLNSHNIMHVMVLAGGWHMHLAFLTDIQIILDNRQS